MKKTILFLIDSFEVLGGAEKNLLSVVSGLNKDKYRVMVGCLKGGVAFDEFKKRGIDIIDLKIKRIYGFKAFLKAQQLIKLIREEKVEIMVTYLESSDFWGCIVAKIAGVRVVISNRRDLGFNLKTRHIWAYRFVNNLFDRIISVCDAVKKSIVERENVNPDKIITIYNGVKAFKESVFNEQELKASLGLDISKKTVTMVANLDPVKGHKDFLLAAARVLKRHNSVQFLLVGTGKAEYELELHYFSDQLGMKKEIVFVGYRPDVARILSISDVSVLPSLSEGFSNAVLESMLAAKPVIAANIGGNSEAIEDGKTGFLFPPHDIDALVNLILLCIQDEALAHNIGKAAKFRVEKFFASEIMLAEIENLFEVLLQKKSFISRLLISVRNKIKKFLKITASNCLYYSRLLGLFEAVKYKKSIPILAYHKIADSDDGLCLSTSIFNFKSQLQYLVKNYKVVSLREAINQLSAKNPLSKKMVVITFDDGSNDIFSNAFPVLKELGIPATVFLAVDPIENRKLLWFEFIAYAIKITGRKTLNLESFDFGRYLINSPYEKRFATKAIVDKAKAMDSELLEEFLQFISIALSVTRNGWDSWEREILSWDEIREMGNANIDFGAHTLSHAILTRLSLKEAEHEICESKRMLENRLGKKVELFAYPNGSDADFNDDIIRILKNNNFLGACALRSANSNGNLFALQRVNLHDEVVNGLRGTFNKPLFAAAIAGIFASSRRLAKNGK